MTITDYKSSDVRDPAKARQRARDSLQLQIYAMGYEAMTGRLPDAIALHFLESGLVGEVAVDPKRLAKAREQIADGGGRDAGPRLHADARTTWPAPTARSATSARRASRADGAVGRGRDRAFARLDGGSGAGASFAILPGSTGPAEETVSEMERIVRLIRPWATTDGSGRPRLDGHGSARPDGQPRPSSARPRVVWLLVGLVVTTRDPLVDPSAGFVGAALIGLAVALTLVPLALADGLRPAPPDRLPRRLAARDPARGLGRHRRRGPRRPAPAGPARAADRAVHDRPRRGRRGDPLRRALTAAPRIVRASLGWRAVRQSSQETAVPALTATRPAAPVRRRQGPPGRRRRGRPRRDPRPVAPDPRRPGARLRGAPRRGLGRRGPGAPRLRGRASGRAASRPRSAPRVAAGAAATARGSGSSPSTTRCPGLGHGCGHNTMAASGVGAAIALASLADELPGEIVFLGTPAEERGSGKQIMIDDGLFDGPRRRAAVPPVRPQPRRELSARVGGRRRRLHGPAVARLVGSVAGQERARRDDPAVHLGRAVAPAAPADGARPRDHPRGRHGGQHHPGPDLGLVHDPERRRGRLRARCATASGELCEAAALATDTTVEVTFSGRARTMRNNRVLAERFRANMAAYGIEDQGDDPNAGSTDMANVSWVCPTIHPDLAIAPEGTPGHSILFRDAAVDPARRRDRPSWRPRSSPRPRYELFADPELVAAAWREFRETADRRQRRVLPSAAARPAGRRVSNRRRPQRDGPDPRRHDAATVSGGSPWLSARPIPTPTATSRATTAGTRDYETYDDFDLPTYVGPTTFMNLPWITDPAELRRRGVDVAIVGAPFDDAVSHRPGARFGPRAIREAQYTSGSIHSLQLDVDAVRGPDRRRRRRRQHRAGLDRARPRDDLPQGPRGRRRPAPSRSSSAATTRSPGRRRPRSPRSAARAASGSSISTPTPTPPTTPSASWPATARRCAG